MDVLQRLESALPTFPVATRDVDFFTDGGPEAFWERLRAMLRGARRQISLASLYWGTQEREAQLVDDMAYALAASPDLHVRVVVDYSRGRRRTPNGNTVSFLRDLAVKHPGRVEVHLHKMPQFDGLASWLPSPLDECVAVFHFKALVADDEAIITGANLSDEYWHCRQARYIAVRDPAMVSFFHDVVATTADRSLRADYAIPDSPLRDPGKCPKTVHDAVLTHVDQYRRPAAGETVFCPVFQHPTLGLRQEFDLLVQMFGWTHGELIVNTPYPNFPTAYLDALARRVGTPGAGPTRFICPSGNSHSFSTGKGLKALVPGVYLHREKEFVSRLEAAAARSGSPLTFRHYDRDGWVFHSKGVWFTTADETATIIGSSSFGERSVSRDFDLSFLVVTRDPALRQAIRAELDTMLAFADGQRPVERPGAWAVPFLVPLVKGYL